mmetsp:Transcript_1720/g.3361  ORF Transcript_1720/g.3361 Transcript_1720/m.3361 type:complete len:202 (-) Transcript_1720:1185-1790(-)
MTRKRDRSPVMYIIYFNIKASGGVFSKSYYVALQSLSCSLMYTSSEAAHPTVALVLSKILNHLAPKYDGRITTTVPNVALTIASVSDSIINLALASAAHARRALAAIVVGHAAVGAIDDANVNAVGIDAVDGNHLGLPVNANVVGVKRAVETGTGGVGVRDGLDACYDAAHLSSDAILAAGPVEADHGGRAQNGGGAQGGG